MNSGKYKAPPSFRASFRPLLTSNISPDILYGYGDPAVLRVQRADRSAGYFLVVTSNDAPNSIPILRSGNLADWDLVGFVFPQGKKPSWAIDDEGSSDYWAPEMHEVLGEFRVYFTARQKHEQELAIGVAIAPDPAGPFTVPSAPLLGGNVIDPHVLVMAGGDSIMFWKEDTNDIWPSRLTALLHRCPALVERLFASPQDRCTAASAGALCPWLATVSPMERFLAQHPLIETVAANYASFRRCLANLLRHETDPIAGQLLRDVMDNMTTPVYGQRLSPDGRSLVGERHVVLTNDQEWEAHLVEGVWVVEQSGRYYMFYAGNDFSTADYGIGVAVAESPLGPYRKMAAPLVQSTREWSGPGHPSVADGPDGRPRLFFHAFFPGDVGYKRFRALLSLEIEFTVDGVRLR